MYLNVARCSERPHTRQKAFTLLELLVVMAIILVISSFVLVAVGNDDGSRAVDSTISRMDATFALARSAAVSRKTTTRVLVNFDDSSPNYLRSSIIIYLDEDNLWKPFAEAEVFPRNVVYNHALSRNDETRYLQVAIDTNFNVTNPVPPLSETGAPGANQWIAYEFRPNGTAAFPLSRFIVSKGTMVPGQSDPVGLVLETSAGFALFRSGKVVYFKDYEHMSL